MGQSKFEEIFIRLVTAYVKKYKKHSFEICLDEKKCQLIGDSKNIVKVKINNSDEVLRRIFIGGSLGLGESYCEGLISVDDKLYKYFLFIFVRVVHDKKLLLGLPLSDIFLILKAKFNRKFFERNTKSENINSHYSLSDWFDDEKDANDFYMFWLNSKYIQYSCGKWDENTKTLDEAQFNKLNFYAERLEIDKNSRGKTLVDLGCGWGGTMFFMAENYGVKCKGLTLSTAQAEYILDEVKKRNLEDLVSVEIDDIHNLKGNFDFVISVGVMEHISDYDHLYKAISDVLNKNGSVLIHSIFHTNMFYKADTFLQKYIFPGGSTPEIKQNLRIFRRYFKEVDRNDLPENSYPKTLDCWYDNFCKNEVSIRKLLKEKSKVRDIDFSIRIFKHYLTLAHCGLSGKYSLVANVLAKN
ncbi:MAG: class I SAM-dependent methyltransferase [bacterium]|nr:class I SAM-dependent methyltransferase [bacterium]